MTDLPEQSYIVLDASVWVARLVSQDEFHVPVKNWMEQQRQVGAQFISPSLLLAEVGGAISRRLGDSTLSKRAIAQLESLPGVRLVEMDNELAHQAADLAASLGLRGADSFYVAVASQLNLPLVSLDADQRERAKGSVSILSIPIRGGAS